MLLCVYTQETRTYIRSHIFTCIIYLFSLVTANNIEDVAYVSIIWWNRAMHSAYTKLGFYQHIYSQWDDEECPYLLSVDQLMAFEVMDLAYWTSPENSMLTRRPKHNAMFCFACVPGHTQQPITLTFARQFLIRGMFLPYYNSNGTFSQMSFVCVLVADVKT